jgi:Cu2+-exporting ATPase
MREHHKQHSHAGHHRITIRDFRQRFYISTIITIPILILSPLIQEPLEITISIPGERYVLSTLSRKDLE